VSRSERVLLVLLALAFVPALLALARVWRSVDYYSHGFLVPLVAGWIASREVALRGDAVARDRAGIAAVAGALVLHAAGIAVGDVLLEGLALVLAVAGVLVWRFGRARLRALALPLTLLLCAVPLPGEWLTPLIVRLQLVVSAAAVRVLGWMGSDVVREGNVLLLPGGQSLFVAEACSGITSIVTLVPLALVLGTLTLKGSRARALLVLAVIPVAVLCNLLRVIATVQAAQRLGVARATGSMLHDVAGLLTFLLACAALIGLGAWLGRAGRPGARRAAV
jgi:exosortase